MNTVHQLRLSGHKIKISHFRWYWDKANKRWALLTKFQRQQSDIPSHVEVEVKGGLTKVEVTDPEGRTVFHEEKCSDDQGFDRKKGVEITLGRALKMLETKKAEESVAKTEKEDVSAMYFDGPHNL